MFASAENQSFFQAGNRSLEKLTDSRQAKTV
jgi:hypothetical protein